MLVIPAEGDLKQGREFTGSLGYTVQFCPKEIICFTRPTYLIFMITTGTVEADLLKIRLIQA